MQLSRITRTCTYCTRSVLCLFIAGSLLSRGRLKYRDPGGLWIYSFCRPFVCRNLPFTMKTSNVHEFAYCRSHQLDRYQFSCIRVGTWCIDAWQTSKSTNFRQWVLADRVKRDSQSNKSARCLKLQLVIVIEQVRNVLINQMLRWIHLIKQHVPQ